MMEAVIDKGKRFKTTNKVKPVENENTNLQSFIGISLEQMEVSHSHRDIGRID